jgi:nucleotide-binding universal stress UspA family protein
VIKVEKVLANIDLTPTAIKSVEWAKELASKFGAELILFYDMDEVNALGDYANLFAFPVEPNIKEKTKEKVKKAFSKYLEDFSGNYRYEFICCGKGKLAEFIENENITIAVLNEKYLSVVPNLKCQVLITK